jgi:hypothetical protein
MNSHIDTLAPIVIAFGAYLHQKRTTDTEKNPETSVMRFYYY